MHRERARKPLRYAVIALAPCFLAMQSGCEPKAEAPAPPAAIAVATPALTDPGWVHRHQPKARHAVVFVHGLFGDIGGTWTNANGTRFFDLLKDSPIGDQVDIYAFGYTSTMLTSGSLTVNEATAKLDQYMRLDGVLDYDSIVFVGHSMGGLIILRQLIRDDELRRKVPMVALYATPQEGAQIALIGDRLANNPALAQMFPANANAYLQQLDADWKGKKDRPWVSCGYEKRPTGKIMIVPWESATRYCSEQATAIEGEDHLSLVKPDRARHPAMVMLVTEMQKHALARKAGDRRLDVNVAFKAFAGLPGNPDPPALELTLEEPVQQGPFGFRSNGASSPQQYRHSKFLLPAPGDRLFGYLNRVLYTAQRVEGPSAAPIKTRVCLKVTDVDPPANGVAVLDCDEGDTCRPRDGDGVLVACGTASSRSARWSRWLPLATASAAPVEAVAQPDGPAAGDWLVPRLETLRAARSTPDAKAYSEVSIDIDGAPPPAEFDAITFETKINDRRLWVNGLPSWAHAASLVRGEPMTLRFALENLNAVGADRGRERLDVRLMWLKDKRVVADDRVVLDFIALRDQKPSTVRSRDGRTIRWSAAYHPSPADQYQVLAYGGQERDTLAAKQKFDAAGAPRLVGVVRPPNKDNPAWGIAVGRAEGNGQVRFSFGRRDVAAVCGAMMSDPSRRLLRRQGFADPGTFGVRNIASDDGRPMPLLACKTFPTS